MACKTQILESIKNKINVVGEPEFNGFSRQQARQRMKSINEIYPNLVYIEEVGVNNTTYRLVPIQANINKAVDALYQEQLLQEEYEVFKELELRAKETSEYFTSEGDVVPTYEDLEKVNKNNENNFDNPNYISKLYNNGTLINNC